MSRKLPGCPPSTPAALPVFATNEAVYPAHVRLCVGVCVWVCVCVWVGVCVGVCVCVWVCVIDDDTPCVGGVVPLWARVQNSSPLVGMRGRLWAGCERWCGCAGSWMCV